MTRRFRGTGVALTLVAGALLGGWGLWTLLVDSDPGPVQATLSAVGAIAGSDTAGYARATAPRLFEFPRDHGPHPEYRTEWWYLTGNLDGPEGRRLAYQLTFFRNSLAPEPAGRASSWDTNQFWMAHLAVTDVEEERHFVSERLARGAVGLAGGRAAPFRVWLEDWEMRWTGSGGTDPEPAPGLFPLELRAVEDDWGIELLLEAGKPPVLQGEEGWSQKGSEPGNASYYLSFTRMPTRGRIHLEGESFEVQGESWMDREWSTSALDEVHLGWDWFSLQLDDERELMFFELRREDGETEPLNHGTLVAPDGSYRPLHSDEVEVEVLDRWRSPLDGAEYPSGWRIRIPGEGMDLEVRPVLPDQEMNVSVRYWEGAVDVSGRGVDGPVTGRGFVELTGYGETPAVEGGSRGQR